MKSTKIIFVSLDILLAFLNGLSDLFPGIISFLIWFDLSFEELQLQSCPSWLYLAAPSEGQEPTLSAERINSPAGIKVF